MIEGEWKSDGLDANGKATWNLESVEGGQGHVLSMDVTGGSPMNLCYSLEEVPTRYFFRVEILKKSSRSDSFSVGVVRLSEFKKGWGTKGMFYNGNLTNGSSALKVGYGPYLKESDSITLEYVELEDKYQVKIQVNGTELGTSFEISRNGASDEAFVPCLHVQGGLRVRAIAQTESPVLESTTPQVPSLSGDWALVEAFEAPQGTKRIWPLNAQTTELQQNSPVPTATVHFEATNTDEGLEHWMVVLKVYNTIRIIRQIVECPSDDGESGFAIKIPTGVPPGTMSTKMMPPQPFGQIELKLSQIFGSNWKMLRMANGNALAVLSDDGTLLASLERQQYYVTGGPCTSYQ